MLTFIHGCRARDHFHRRVIERDDTDLDYRKVRGTCLPGVVVDLHREAIGRLLATAMHVLQSPCIDLRLGEGCSCGDNSLKYPIIVAVELQYAVTWQSSDAQSQGVGQNATDIAVHIGREDIFVVNYDGRAFVHQNLVQGCGAGNEGPVVDGGVLQRCGAWQNEFGTVGHGEFEGGGVGLATVMLKLDFPVVQVSLGKGVVDAQVTGIDANAVKWRWVEIKRAGAWQLGQGIDQLRIGVVDVGSAERSAGHGNHSALVKAGLGADGEHRAVVLGQGQHRDRGSGRLCVTGGGILNGVSKAGRPRKI